VVCPQQRHLHGAGQKQPRTLHELTQQELRLHHG